MRNISYKHDFWSVSVGHLPLQNPVIVSEDTSIEDTIIQMQEHTIGCALVVNKKNNLSGIVTGLDIMGRFIQTTTPRKDPIRNIMTSNVLTMAPESLISDVVILLGKSNIRHIPICEGPKIVGLLSVRILVTFIAEHLPEDVLNLPPYTERISQDPFGA